MESENILAYELGYRVQPTENATIDLAGFYHQYTDLMTLESGTTAVDPALGVPVVPLTWENLMKGKTYGMELSGAWAVTTGLKLNLGYALLKMDADLAPTSNTTISFNSFENEHPLHQVHLRTYLDLPFDVIQASLIKLSGAPQKVTFVVIQRNSSNYKKNVKLNI